MSLSVRSSYHESVVPTCHSSRTSMNCYITGKHHWPVNSNIINYIRTSLLWTQNTSHCINTAADDQSIILPFSKITFNILQIIFTHLFRQVRSYDKEVIAWLFSYLPVYLPCQCLVSFLFWTWRSSSSLRTLFFGFLILLLLLLDFRNPWSFVNTQPIVIKTSHRHLWPYNHRSTVSEFWVNPK